MVFCSECGKQVNEEYFVVRECANYYVTPATTHSPQG
jgi:hypothetical protein